MTPALTPEERAILRELIRVPEVRRRLNPVAPTPSYALIGLIGLILGITKPRVQQIEQKALHKIRRAMMRYVKYGI